MIIERVDNLKKNIFKIINVALIVLLVCYLYFSVENVQKNKESENLNILSDAIRRSAVQCYAIEGFYPPNIDFLENNYGLVVDHDKYVISYSVFASNIMPDIEVYLK